MPTWMTLLLGRLAKSAPACLAGIIAMGAVLYAYGQATYATVEDMEAWAETIDASLNKLAGRVELDGLERNVSDINAQIRTKEREIADLEMVIAELGTDAPRDSVEILRDRLFTLRQDLNTLNQRLTTATSTLANKRLLAEKP